MLRALCIDFAVVLVLKRLGGNMLCGKSDSHQDCSTGTKEV